MTAWWLLLGPWPAVCVVVVGVGGSSQTWRRPGGLLAASVVMVVVGVGLVLRGDLGVGLLLCGNALVGALATATATVVVALTSEAPPSRRTGR